MQVVCVKCGDDGGCWGYEDLIPTLQTPTVATVARNTAPSAPSDICLLLLHTDETNIVWYRRHASGKAGAVLGSCHPRYPLLSAPSPLLTSRQPLDLVVISAE